MNYRTLFILWLVFHVLQICQAEIATVTILQTTDIHSYFRHNGDTGNSNNFNLIDSIHYERELAGGF